MRELRAPDPEAREPARRFGRSRRMYVVTVTAFTLWLAYGIARRVAMIAGNGVCLLLAAAILALKIRRDRQERAGGRLATTTE